MRRDAQERRGALIAAAAEIFAERGYSVPLEDVAARAGVGRGTLYRNFKDREALALAIFGSEIDNIGDIVARGHDLRRSLIDLALAGTRGTALFARIAAELVAESENMAALEALGVRVATALEPLAVRAHASGELRGDVGGEGLGLALRMVGNLLHNFQDEEEQVRLLDQALDLIFDGIRPR